jgi:hypothetical protein
MRHPVSRILLLDSADYAADTSRIDFAARLVLFSLRLRLMGSLGGKDETHASRARAGGGVAHRVPSHEYAAELRMWTALRGMRPAMRRRL